MTYAAAGNKATAQRIETAYANFAETLIRIADITSDEANKVTALYLKNKLAKMDAVIGRISVKHGAFLDRSAILNAVEMAR